MFQTCKITNQKFEVTDSDLEFLKKISPTFDGKFFQIPPPTICPEERIRRRTGHRNENVYHHNKSALSGKPLISIYRSDSEYKIYSQEEFFSDKWDALSYGQDFNFNKNFFEQFEHLNKKVPKVAMINMKCENCDYTCGTGMCKNCYLINSSEYCEDCYYGKLIQSSKNCIDCAFIYDSELMYECFNVRNGYNCKFVYYSQNIIDCWFCDDCKNCQNCFLCTNLVGKKYHFFNQQLSKEEYENRVKEFVGSYQNFTVAKKMFDDLRLKRIYKYATIINCENCTGDFINNCKNCIDCYEMNDSEDSKYIQVGVKIKDCLDCSNMYIKPELSYEVMGTLETYNIHFCTYVFYSSNMWYCSNCFNSKNCFGCSGLQHKEYCIFNKQYTKEEYEKLVAKIIESMQSPHPPLSRGRSTSPLDKGDLGDLDLQPEWGEFFPISMSPFPYNDSVAYDYCPLTKEETLAKKYVWKDPDASYQHQGVEYIIPDNINDVKDDIKEAILKCESTNKLYKIIPHELKFYREQKIPIPRKCPQERYRLRLLNRNPFVLYDRNCLKCGSNIKTTYAPERLEIIYCEKCYLEKVY
ncbi:MAG: hypothetical protein UR28_C0006G0018 [Candidatus Peregrinibacteria bacterium GW2011_GWF2_33_10]|nr:MAG: hypothetical protein UR28_C0006G0018 [Candidatus Peregrinibacteria bacterium GW2011_GWF2_33_10]OGJ45061.1 MAG: hypothetical protein A2263_02395 [Candidatus Peregrinibacteria bacterium RIFOXYA2_FULL_33_21]OGJ50855.1 MAG: hypothetical protein A2307_00660 [Candidatus Peregrinibacteria bacterium RIFOXYB2_FULL_33_20]